jgi:hypothetical protein
VVLMDAPAAEDIRRPWSRQEEIGATQGPRIVKRVTGQQLEVDDGDVALLRERVHPGEHRILIVGGDDDGPGTIVLGWRASLSSACGMPSSSSSWTSHGMSTTIAA